MKYELKQYLNSINYEKNNIMDEDPDSIKDYPSYIINRCLSGHLDCILYVNEMNIYNSLSNKMQYDFYINSLRAKKRFSPWLRKEKIEELECVKKYYGYSNEKALQALRLLSKDQIDYIKSKLEPGGYR